MCHDHRVANPQDPKQLYYFDNDEKTAAPYDGEVVLADRVILSVRGAHRLTEGEGCSYGKRAHDSGGSLCVETTFLTPEEGAENTGAFIFDFGAAQDGYGRPLLWNSTWDGRYEFMQVRTDEVAGGGERLPLTSPSAHTQVLITAKDHSTVREGGGLVRVSCRL